MHALALVGLLALCATGWALPALNPLLERQERLKRDLEGGVSLKCTFDTIAEANKNVVQQPGKYFVTDLDIARPTRKIAGMCTSGTCTWPKNPDGNVYIPYTQTKDYTRYHNIVFLTVFREFASATCIRFVPRTNETDYITFESGSGCWSPIGRIGKQQFVSLAKSSCMVTGVIAHQLMHSLGFHHEHVRKDRDNYVAVQWDNILSDHEYEFEMIDTNNMKYTPYDYGSILHYGRNAYSKDGVSQTLIPVPDSSVNIGQTFAMSDVDIQKINLLYSCELAQYPCVSLDWKHLCSAGMGTRDVDGSKPAFECLWVGNTSAWSASVGWDCFGRANSYLENPKSNLEFSQSTTSAITTTTTTPTATTPTTTSTPSTTMKTTTTTTAAPTTTTTSATSTTVKATAALMKIITSTPTTTTKTTAATTTPTTLGTTTTVSNDQACGGTLTANSGEITTPYYPEQYPRSTQCTWIIRATKLVNITFVDFELESGSNCMFDYMKFDDLSEVPVYIPNSKYCGTVAPNTWVSFRSSVQIIFSSDSTVQMRGFKLRYTAE